MTPNLDKLKEKLEDMQVKGIRLSTVNIGSYSDMEKLSGEILWIIDQLEQGLTTPWQDY